MHLGRKARNSNNDKHGSDKHQIGHLKLPICELTVVRRREAADDHVYCDLLIAVLRSLGFAFSNQS